MQKHLSGIHKKISNYATCSSNNWVKLRCQPKLPMALNGKLDAELNFLIPSVTIANKKGL